MKIDTGLARVGIATFCGWTEIHYTERATRKDECLYWIGKPPKGARVMGGSAGDGFYVLPSYFTDHNAIHEVIEKLNDSQVSKMERLLKSGLRSTVNEKAEAVALMLPQ